MRSCSGSDEPVAVGVGGGGGAGGDVELAADRLDVFGGGTTSDPERLGDLFVGLAFDEEVQDSELTRC